MGYPSNGVGVGTGGSGEVDTNKATVHVTSDEQDKPLEKALYLNRKRYPVFLAAVAQSPGLSFSAFPSGSRAGRRRAARIFCGQHFAVEGFFQRCPAHRT